MMARLVRFTGIEERPAPAMRAELRQYQREGYHWLAFLYEHGFGACLADDMGLGKTVQAICLLAAMKEGKVLPPGFCPHGAQIPDRRAAEPHIQLGAGDRALLS